MHGIPNSVRYISASALISVGLLLVAYGGQFMRYADGPIRPFIGALLAICGVETITLSYVLVSSLRFEAPFRAMASVLFAFWTISSLGFLVFGAVPPRRPSAFGFVHWTAAQAGARGLVGAVYAWNLIHLYRIAGAGWKAKPRQAQRR